MVFECGLKMEDFSPKMEVLNYRYRKIRSCIHGDAECDGVMGAAVIVFTGLFSSYMP